MTKFAESVAIYGARGLMYYADRSHAERLFRARNAKRLCQGKLVTELLMEDFNPSEKNEDHRPSNSLRAGYMQTLNGGELVSIETAKESRKLTTEPCRSYKLKRIPETLRPLYRMAVLDNLTPARA